MRYDRTTLQTFFCSYTTTTLFTRVSLPACYCFQSCAPLRKIVNPICRTNFIYLMSQIRYLEYYGTSLLYTHSGHIFFNVAKKISPHILPALAVRYSCFTSVSFSDFSLYTDYFFPQVISI